MVSLLALVVTVGILDSLNPSTVGPALYLATRTKGHYGVGVFTAGVFGVSLLGGLVLTLGPGHAILTALPRPGRHAIAVIELSLGAVILLVALGLWHESARVLRRIRKDERRVARAPLILGAAIMAVELPTALPYFAVIAAIVGSGRPLSTQIALLILFNAVFVAPLVAITAASSLAHNRVQGPLDRLRADVDRHAASLLPALVALVGVVLITIGALALMA